MKSRRIGEQVQREAPTVGSSAPLEDAVRCMLESGLPAVPVVDEREHLVGIVGEREFLAAFFPTYLGELKYAGFVRRGFEGVLEDRGECLREPVVKHLNREHVDVPADAADIHVVETFLHHRVLMVPVTDQRRVVGAITRADFFRALAEDVLQR